MKDSRKLRIGEQPIKIENPDKDRDAHISNILSFECIQQKEYCKKTNCLKRCIFSFLSGVFVSLLCFKLSNTIDSPWAVITIPIWACFIVNFL